MTNWIEETAHFGVKLSPSQIDQFDHYLNLLFSWNQRINLTAIVEPAEIQRRHFLDSLSCVLATGDLNGMDVIDVGSGAGFPGLPLKIAFPHMRLTLGESVAKKCRFLSAVVEGLKLEGVEIVNERAERLGQDPAYRERFDRGLGRAVARLPALVEYLLPLLKVGGMMAAQKGGQAAIELEEARNAIHILGGDEPKLLPVSPQLWDADRYLIVVTKSGATPTKYPRRAGMPAKKPL